MKNRTMIFVIFLMLTKTEALVPMVSSPNAYLAGTTYLNRVYGEIVGEASSLYIVANDIPDGRSAVHKLDVQNMSIGADIHFEPNKKLLDACFFDSCLYVLAQDNLSRKCGIWRLMSDSSSWVLLAEIPEGHERIHVWENGFAAFKNDKFVIFDHELNESIELSYADLQITIPDRRYCMNVPSSVTVLENSWLIGFNYGEFRSGLYWISLNDGVHSFKELSANNVYEMKTMGNQCFVLEQDGMRNNFFGRISSAGELTYQIDGNNEAMDLARTQGFILDKSYHRFGTCSLNVRTFDLDADGNAYLLSDIGILQVGIDGSIEWIVFFDRETCWMLKVFDARRQIVCINNGFLILYQAGVDYVCKESGTYTMKTLVVSGVSPMK